MDEALRRVAQHRPRTLPPRGLQAATALILCTEPEPRFVVIRRVTRKGDPWSGHAALPGGRCDATDRDAVETARREAAEEVGVTLPEPVGALDDIGGKFRGGGVVTPVVFAVPRATPLRPDPREVAGAYWAPLALLTDPAARTRHPYRRLGPFPAWNYPTGEQAPLDSLVIWGLTHRILKDFLKVSRLAGASR